MNLDDAQKQKVVVWLQQGSTLAEVQKRLETEFGLRLTYCEVKFVVSDLQVLPKDAQPPTPSVLTSKPAKPGQAPQWPAPRTAATEDREAKPSPPLPAGRVQVTVDQLARPGAVVSGSVTFSDGKSAGWYIDQMGRIGIAPKDKGHRPSAADMQEFQLVLEQELARQGF